MVFYYYHFSYFQANKPKTKYFYKFLDAYLEKNQEVLYQLHSLLVVESLMTIKIYQIILSRVWNPTDGLTGYQDFVGNFGILPTGKL